MVHAIEKLLEMDYEDAKQKKQISSTILDNINQIWNENFHIDKKSVDDLFDSLSFKVKADDISYVKYVLELLLESTQDEQTLPILVHNLRSGYRYRSSMIVGWYGSRGQEAIPLLLYHAGGNHFAKTAQQALRRIGVTLEELFSAIRKNIKERDGLAVVQLLFFTLEEFPRSIVDPRLCQLLQKASECKNTGVKGAVLEFLEHQNHDTKAFYKMILESLSKETQVEIKKKASLILESINNSSV
jgi:hypothetical protein